MPCEEVDWYESVEKGTHIQYLSRVVVCVGAPGGGRWETISKYQDLGELGDASDGRRDGNPFPTPTLIFHVCVGLDLQGLCFCYHAPSHSSIR